MTRYRFFSKGLEYEVSVDFWVKEQIFRDDPDDIKDRVKLVKPVVYRKELDGSRTKVKVEELK